MLYKHTVTARTLESWQSEQLRQVKGKGLRQHWLAQGYITSNWPECPFTAVATAIAKTRKKTKWRLGLCKWEEPNEMSVLLWADRLVGPWFPCYLFFCKAMPEHSWQVLEDTLESRGEIKCPLSLTHNRYIRSDTKHEFAPSLRCSILSPSTGARGALGYFPWVVSDQFPAMAPLPPSSCREGKQG